MPRRVKRGCKLAQAPLTEYDDVRISNLMRNSTRLQQLGIRTTSTLLATPTCYSPEKKNNKRSCHESSGSEYDPGQDDTSAEDVVDQNLVHEMDALEVHDSSTAKGLTTSKKSHNKGSKKTGEMGPGVARPGPPKRVLASSHSEQFSRVTRSKKNVGSQQELEGSTQIREDNLTLTTLPVQQRYDPTNGIATDGVGHVEDHTQPSQRDGVGLHDELTDMHNESNGDCQLDVRTETRNEVARRAGAEDNSRTSMGKGLDKMARARGAKIPLVIGEGRTRPEAPVIAAKFASECNIAIRQHMPIPLHWKEYKDSTTTVENFVGRIAARFAMNTQDEPTKQACTEMLKKGLRQQRHNLKKKWFDPYPLHLVRKTSPVESMDNNQWLELVELWKNPKKQDTCEKNRHNRAQVKFHHTTGSRSYDVHLHTVKKDKYGEQEPNALDLFKECHNSSKKGFSENVQLAIAEMEARMAAPVEDGQEPKSVTAVVAEVLNERTKVNSFLKNVGIQQPLP